MESSHSIGSENQQSPEANQQSVEVTKQQYANAQSYLRGYGKINPETFAEDLTTYMGERDSKTGEIISPSETETTKQQAEAILADFEDRGLLTEFTEERDGDNVTLFLLDLPESTKNLGSPELTPRQSKARKFLGKVAGTKAAKLTVTHSKEFGAHNSVTAILTGPRREAAAKTEAAEKIKKRPEIGEEIFNRETSRRARLILVDQLSNEPGAPIITEVNHQTESSEQPLNSDANKLPTDETVITDQESEASNTPEKRKRSEKAKKIGQKLTQVATKGANYWISGLPKYGQQLAESQSYVTDHVQTRSRDSSRPETEIDGQFAFDFEALEREHQTKLQAEEAARLAELEQTASPEHQEPVPMPTVEEYDAAEFLTGMNHASEAALRRKFGWDSQKSQQVLSKLEQFDIVVIDPASERYLVNMTPQQLDEMMQELLDKQQ